MITNQQTGRSKGFGFIEFTNYKEFQTALSQKEPIIFGKQQLVFNSAKNKYDNDDEFKDNNVMNKNNNSKLNVNEENNNSSNGNDSFDNSVSTAIISRDSNGSNNSNNLGNIINCFKGENNGFLGAKNKPDIKKIYKNEDPDDLLTLQIKYALSKMQSFCIWPRRRTRSRKRFGNTTRCCRITPESALGAALVKHAAPLALPSGKTCKKP